MRTVAIIYTECSIRAYYDACSIRVSQSFSMIQAEKGSNQCHTLSPWAPALLLLCVVQLCCLVMFE